MLEMSSSSSSSSRGRLSSSPAHIVSSDFITRSSCYGKISSRRNNYNDGVLNRPYVHVVLCTAVVALLSQSCQPGFFVLANDYYNYYNNNNNNRNNGNYYNNYNNYNNNNGNNNNYNNGNNNNNNYNNNDDDGNDDDDYFNNDDGNNYNYDNDDDDGNGNDDDGDADANDDGNDYYYGGDDDDDDGGNDDYANYMDDGGNNNDEAQYKNADDDVFHWNSNIGFDGVSVMPISCINYNNGHMIKFQLFDSENSYQCHFSEIATFVVSIAHYMRSYFNYQALLVGNDFELPGDAGYLNCILLEETANSEVPLYAKVGCMERETFTSTKLQLHLYTDAQCSQPYDDGQSSRRHASKGYEINGYVFPTKVSFRPPFYSCESCTPDAIADTFNKKNSNWYDDDYISSYGKKNNNNYKGNDDAQDGDDDDNYQDDAYMAANDDVNYNDGYNGNNDDNNKYNYNYDDDFYNDRMRHRGLKSSNKYATIMAAPKALQAYKNEFWKEYEVMQRERSLYENNYDVGDWNMCQRIYKYGVWCDEECRALDFFRTDQWSASDIFLLSIMCTFVTAMMLLVVAKRLKAQQKAKIYREEQPMPGLPPLGMALIFVFIMLVIVTLAKLRFVNETLVFAVVTCILLFIYILKLTLFETRRPVLLAAPRHHEMFDNPMDERLFD